MWFMLPQWNLKRTPVVVMLIITLNHGTSGQAMKQQLLEEIFFTLVILEAYASSEPLSLIAAVLLLLVDNYALL